MGDLLSEKLITSDEAEELSKLGQKYRIRIPRYYANLIDRSRADCPIRLQAIPNFKEQDPVLPLWAKQWSLEAFGRDVPWHDDAIGDIEKLSAPRLTHRYGNRAILHLSSLCALYCRFCFRKSHLNDDERTLYDGSLEPAIDYLREHTEISEIILTGGDPLSLPDNWLDRFLTRLEGIKSIKHVRLHSRMIVTLPSRMTVELTRVLNSKRFLVSVVSHFNHPRELTTEAIASLALLRKSGVPLYNQSVLLNGVNNSSEILAPLFQELFENGVRPFYLHHPDWTPGTFGFRLSIESGLEIMRALRGVVSGPALPLYVLDIPHGGGKVSLDSSSVELVEKRTEASFSGALYQIRKPHTRASNEEKATALYAEIWKN